MSSEAVIKKSARWHVLIGSFFSNMYDFFDLMLLSVTLPLIMVEFGISISQAGLIGTATLIGCGISAFIWGWVSDNKGRKTALISSVVFFSILTASLAFVYSYEWFLTIRFLGGIALGGIFTIVGTLINETWPAHLRAKATAGVFTSSPVGLLVTGILATVLLPTYGWRPMFLITISGLLVALYMYFFVPESEVWKNQRDKLKAAAKKSIPLGEGLKEMFSGQHLKVTIFATLASFLAQLTYWGFVFWFPTFLVKERMVAPGKVGTFLAIMTLGIFVAYPLAGWIADKIGRKKTLIIAFVAGGIMIPLYASIQNVTLLYWIGPIAMMCFVYPALFGAYFPELYPTHIRTLGAGFVFNIGRSLSAIGPFTLALIATQYNLQTSISICGLMYLCAGIMILFLPETFNRKKDKAPG